MYRTRVPVFNKWPEHCKNVWHKHCRRIENSEWYEADFVLSTLGDERGVFARAFLHGDMDKSV